MNRAKLSTSNAAATAKTMAPPCSKQHAVRRISDFAENVRAIVASHGRFAPHRDAELDHSGGDGCGDGCGSDKNLTPLPEGFVPAQHDVICARGKTAFGHPGNRRFRVLLSLQLDKYANATSKIEKSVIVTSIVDAIRESSHSKGGGGFVREEGSRWYAVNEHLAREKVGQGFRDLLHEKYKSSTKAKKRRRKDRTTSTSATTPADADIDCNDAMNVDAKMAELSKMASAEHGKFQGYAAMIFIVAFRIHFSLIMSSLYAIVCPRSS